MPIIFIDLRDQGIGDRFAWWDVDRECFETHSQKQTWQTFSEFAKDYQGRKLFYYRQLAMPWTGVEQGVPEPEPEDGTLLSTALVHQRLNEIRPISKQRLHDYISTRRLKAKKNPLHKRYEVTETELQRFIDEGFSQINPKGGGSTQSRGKRRSRLVPPSFS